MSRSGIGGREALIDSELEESLDDEDEHDSIDGTESSIWQYTTQPSSNSVGACGCTIALRVAVEAGGCITSTLTYFPFGACDEAALSLFILVLILSTPPLAQSPSLHFLIRQFFRAHLPPAERWILAQHWPSEQTLY
jgi:hypothetical protein